MRLRRAIPAALVDAGFAALATFAIGVYSVRSLSAAELGTYALFLSAFLTVSTIPKQLVLVPGEVRAIELGLERTERLLVMPQSIKLAVGPAIVASSLGAIAGVLLAGSAPSRVVLPLAGTMAVAAVLQPLQAHVRRMMHLAGVSWHAATISIVQFISAVTSLAVFTVIGIATPWIPFSAFIVANALSVVTALIIERQLRHANELVRFRFRDVVRSGSRLVTVEFVPAATRFLVAALVLRIAGAEVLGLAEAARVVARPVGVFADATIAPIRPRVFEAAINRDQSRGRRISRLYATLLLTAAAVYLAYAGFEWRGNLMARLLPKAYVVEGLAAASIVGASLEKVSSPWRGQLVGGKRESTLIRIEVVGNALRVWIAIMAGQLRSFAIPLGLIATGIVRSIGRSRATRRMYESPSPQRMMARDAGGSDDSTNDAVTLPDGSDG